MHRLGIQNCWFAHPSHVLHSVSAVDGHRHPLGRAGGDSGDCSRNARHAGVECEGEVLEESDQCQLCLLVGKLETLWWRVIDDRFQLQSKNNLKQNFMWEHTHTVRANGSNLMWYVSFRTRIYRNNLRCGRAMVEYKQTSIPLTATVEIFGTVYP